MATEKLFRSKLPSDTAIDATREQEGKVWLVTGAGRRRGIGAAILREAVARGARSLAFTTTERSLPEAVQVESELTASGARTLLLTGDVTKPGVAESWVQRTADEFGQLDVVVNNIGGGGPYGRFVDLTAEQVRETMEVNFFGNLWVAKAAIVQMLRQRPPAGTIVFTGSMAYRGAVYRIPYGVAKAALVGTVAGLAREYPDLKFYVLNPRLTQTDLIAEYTEEQVRNVLRATGQPAIDTPIQVARAFLDLVAPDSNAESGGTYSVTGERLN
jgi:7-alpha-hydroxysteroid dehydrogenase